MNRRIILKYSLFIWLGLIWLISSLPGDTLPQIDALNFDKFAHVFVYMVLSLLLFLNQRHDLFKNKSQYDLLCFAVIMASLDEAHQIFIKFRAVSELDLAANLLGLFIGYIIIKHTKIIL